MPRRIGPLYVQYPDLHFTLEKEAVHGVQSKTIEQVGACKTQRALQ